MTIAIEPMITEGSELVKTLDDGWTVVKFFVVISQSKKKEGEKPHHTKLP